MFRYTCINHCVLSLSVDNKIKIILQLTIKSVFLMTARFRSHQPHGLRGREQPNSYAWHQPTAQDTVYLFIDSFCLTACSSVSLACGSRTLVQMTASESSVSTYGICYRQRGHCRGQQHCLHPTCCCSGAQSDQRSADASYAKYYSYTLHLGHHASTWRLLSTARLYMCADCSVRVRMCV